MGRMFGEFTIFKRLAKKVWRMNRSAKGLLIVTITLDGFSLANHRPFAKFAKLSTRQTILLYSTSCLCINVFMFTFCVQLCNYLVCICFISLIKMLYWMVSKTESPLTERQLVHAIQRNFDGLDKFDTTKIFLDNVDSKALVQSFSKSSKADKVQFVHILSITNI